MNLRQIRKKKHKTQKELSEAVGVNQSSISHFEKGIRNPSIHIAKALAKELDCTIDELFQDPEEDLSEE